MSINPPKNNKTVWDKSDKYNARRTFAVGWYGYYDFVNQTTEEELHVFAIQLLMEGYVLKRIHRNVYEIGNVIDVDRAYCKVGKLFEQGAMYLLNATDDIDARSKIGYEVVLEDPLCLEKAKAYLKLPTRWAIGCTLGMRLFVNPDEQGIGVVSTQDLPRSIIDNSIVPIDEPWALHAAAMETLKSGFQILRNAANSYAIHNGRFVMFSNDRAVTACLLDKSWHGQVMAYESFDIASPTCQEDCVYALMTWSDKIYRTG